MDFAKLGSEAKSGIEQCILDLVSIRPCTNAEISQLLGIQCERINGNKHERKDYISWSIIMLVDKKVNDKFIRNGEHYSSKVKSVHNYNVGDLFNKAQEYMTQLLDLILFLISKQPLRNCEIRDILNIPSTQDWFSWSLLSILLKQKRIEKRGNFHYIINYSFAFPEEIELREMKGYSRKQINWLDMISKKDKIKIQHAESGGEYVIPNCGKRRADGFCKETNTIYEFHGCYYHGCPKHFTPASVNKRLKETFEELYRKTLVKEQKIKELGYNLVVIWECDFDNL
ncbi:hypothetical protein PV-S19_0204 [Pacmanvirus S19]|nr:hypothetical protein PV-S19_0204 [Pacmanvirus S19]